MVAFDNTVLSILLFEDADLRQGPDGRPVECARERVLGLVREIDDAREQVVIPAPALAECLVTDGTDMQDVLATIHGSAFIRIEGFDERAAVELAMRLRAARKAGDPKEGLRITKNEMKFDRQIVAIALVNEASVLYSDDKGVAAFARACGLTVKGVVDLRIPVTQQSLEFDEPCAGEEAGIASANEPEAQSEESAE
jgi:hypothetical protein